MAFLSVINNKKNRGVSKYSIILFLYIYYLLLTLISFIKESIKLIESLRAR